MPIPLADAVAVSGATTGKVLAEVAIDIPSLTAAQKTALSNFITSLGGQWPGAASNIWGITLRRVPQTPGTISCTVYGVLVYADPASAVAAENAGQIAHIIGQA